MTFHVAPRMYAHACDLVQISDSTAATENIVHANLPCSAPYPIGREHLERSFHHTPDIGMGDPGRPHVIFIKAGHGEPTPALRVRFEGVSYGIRAINIWRNIVPQFYEVLLELP